MKRLVGTVSVCVAAMLMLLGSCGIGIQRCSCSGHISIAMPADQGCCGDSGCMTVKVMDIPTAITNDNTVTIHNPPLQFTVPSFTDIGLADKEMSRALPLPTVDNSPPVDIRKRNSVMRV